MKNRIVKANNVTFDSLLEQFFFEKNHREETQKGYIKVVNQLLKFNQNLLPDQLTHHEVIIWRAQRLKVIKAITWNNNVRHLYALYNFGIQHKLLQRPDNPFSGVKVISGKSRRKTYLETQLEHLDRFIHNPLNERIDIPQFLQPYWFTKCLVGMLRYTAIRRGQLLKLCINDIDMQNRIIHVREEINKNHQYYEIPINQKLYPYLDKLLHEHLILGSKKDTQLFNINLFSSVTRYHKVMTQEQLSHFFRVLSSVLQFTLSPHRFRHTVATKLMRNPDNIYIVQKLLGHKSLATTLGYVDHSVDMLRECVETL